MRADRLVAALLLLQARGRITAAALARELEVSVATARRDLEALSAAGIPVYPQAGRGGGWQLVGGARTDLTGLSAPEARALFLLLGPASSVGPSARGALRKLLQALPGTFRAEAAAAAEAVVVDPAGWGERARERPEVALLLDAVVARRVVEFDYAGRGGAMGRDGATGRRRAQPWGLVDKDGSWYLVAGTAGGRRTFRVDRMAAVAQTHEEFRRPEDLDLPGAWDEVVGEMERRRSLVGATVLVPARLLPVLQDRFGRHCAVEGGADAGGRVRLRVAAHTTRSVAEQLAGFGGAVEVLDPPAVRAELAALGAELIARHGGA